VAVPEAVLERRISFMFLIIHISFFLSSRAARPVAGDCAGGAEVLYYAAADTALIRPSIYSLSVSESVPFFVNVKVSASVAVLSASIAV